jgi:HPr kinase/phosphorylase
MKPHPGHAPMAIHATAVVFREAGILIRGPSGSGKSGLAVAMLELAHSRNCYGALIGDDRVVVQPLSGRLKAHCAANIEGLIEHRGIGIVQTGQAVSALIRLVVDLLPRGQELPRIAIREETIEEIAGIAVPRLILGGAASPFERAYAVIEELDRRSRGQTGAIANFA